MNSFFPDGVNSWNNVISHFKTIPSVDIFKRHILSLVRPEKKVSSAFMILLDFGSYFSRVGLSTLRYHKKRHNFIDTPSDKCCCNHGPEDINHFFFSCPFYTTCRTTLITNVMIILQKYNLTRFKNLSSIYLYGHRLIKFADNRSILLSTIKYLKESRCFST